MKMFKNYEKSSKYFHLAARNLDFLKKTPIKMLKIYCQWVFVIPLQLLNLRHKFSLQLSARGGNTCINLRQKLLPPSVSHRWAHGTVRGNRKQWPGAIHGEELPQGELLNALQAKAKLVKKATTHL